MGKDGYTGDVKCCLKGAGDVVGSVKVKGIVWMKQEGGSTMTRAQSGEEEEARSSR